jgi:hypothetical protein
MLWLCSYKGLLCVRVSLHSMTSCYAVYKGFLEVARSCVECGRLFPLVVNVVDG